MHEEQQNGRLSRATSISRSHKQGSTMSRNQSLIRKNVASHDLRPSDVLIERFTAWKAIVKQLIAYFEGIADIENNTAKELTKLGAVIQVPFRSGNQFLGEGGLQDIYYAIRDKTRTIADQHANLGRTIDSSIVQHLQKLRTEIKAHIKNIQNDTGKLATTVAREREMSAKLIGDLAAHIGVFKNTPMGVTAKSDPYVSNQAVSLQLTKQVHAENLLQKSIITIQQTSAHFEAGLIRSIQSAWLTYSEWQSRSSAAIQAIWEVLNTNMQSLQEDSEWISFAARSDHLLDPETPLRDPEAVNYPSKSDPSVLPVHSGTLQRKKRYTRQYRESFFVLTPAGFLHEYTSSDPVVSGGVGGNPIFSLFLPACTLGPPSSHSASSHKFHIEMGNEGALGTNGGGSNKRGLKARLSLKGRGEHAYSFRARSHEDMMEWWNDIRMLCARYLVASEVVERSGPVMAAVRSAGYASSEEEMSGSEEGSSVEEDEEDEEEEEFQVAREDTGPPQYEHAGQATGYPADKKITGGNSDHDANVNRRPSTSKRQLEKAPEGQTPHEPANAGAPPIESKFTEAL